MTVRTSAVWTPLACLLTLLASIVAAAKPDVTARLKAAALAWRKAMP